MKQNSEKRLDDVYMRSFFELIHVNVVTQDYIRRRQQSTMQIVDVLDLFYLIIRHNHQRYKYNSSLFVLITADKRVCVILLSEIKKQNTCEKKWILFKASLFLKCIIERIESKIICMQCLYIRSWALCIVGIFKDKRETTRSRKSKKTTSKRPTMVNKPPYRKIQIE